MPFGNFFDRAEVCSRFGAALAVDGSSAPLHEVRKFRHRGVQDQFGRLGAALKITGVFDVPLCPTWVVASESLVTTSTLFAFVAWLISQEDTNHSSGKRACMFDSRARLAVA